MAFQPWVLKNCDPVPHEFLGTIEYFSEIHPHVSKYASATIDAAKAAQHDWKALNKQLGSESHLGTWVALSLPATLQERVFCLAYPNEAAVFEEDGNRSLELLEVVNDTDSLPTEVQDDQKVHRIFSFPRSIIEPSTSCILILNRLKPPPLSLILLSRLRVDCRRSQVFGRTSYTPASPFRY